MVTLAEIESAAAGLSPAEKQELMLFLASRLRAEGAPLPGARDLVSGFILFFIERKHHKFPPPRGWRPLPAHLNSFPPPLHVHHPAGGGLGVRGSALTGTCRARP